MSGTLKQRVAQVPEVTVLFLRLHLQVRERRQQHRIPVHQALAAVDQSLFVQAHEHLGHRTRQHRVHGEAVARPIHRVPEPAHLRSDGAAGLLLPFPHPLEEGLARQVGAPHALGVQLSFHHHLRGDAGVVGPRLPQGSVPAHTVIAGEGVHERVLERVPHVQRPGHVRRRDHDAVGRTRTAGREPAVRFPTLVDAPLDVLWRVGLVHQM